MNAEEQAYLDLCARIVAEGERRTDRTGTGTFSLFAPPALRFSLENDRFPLLTTKRTFFRGIAEELFWFINGRTDARLLAARGVHIWDGNGSREFLDGRGLQANREGDLGPVYGFQWRHFGAEYRGCDADYAGCGVDQLQQVIDTLKTDPFSRRIVLSVWNPLAEKHMALPPCHILCQFYVSERADGRRYLSCQMYQRSGDMGLGVPFNIASYALLTKLVAHVTGLEPGEFVHVLGDAHVYANHVDALAEQCARTPASFPTLRIARPVARIEDFTLDDLVLENYTPQKKIGMPMAV